MTSIDVLNILAIIGIVVAAIAVFLFRLLTGDWWQYRATRRREFKEYTKGECFLFKAFNWAYDLCESF